MHIKTVANVSQFVAWYHSKFKSSYGANYPSLYWDHLVLIQLATYYEVQSFCEIGTWKGDTALLMWLLPKILRVKAIDIHKDMDIAFTDALHSLQEKDMYGEKFRHTGIQLTFADTMTYMHGTEQHDMVFIDGNHDYAHIKNDTMLALSWNPKVIVWHDVIDSHPDIIKFIGELKENGSILNGGFENSICVAAEPKNIKI